MSFGDQLKQCREEMGLSRGEVAEKLGVSVSKFYELVHSVEAHGLEIAVPLYKNLHV